MLINVNVIYNVRYVHDYAINLIANVGNCRRDLFYN